MPASDPQRHYVRPLLAAALESAARGWYVIPLRPHDKVPAFKRWPELATTDTTTLADWWSLAPYNIGIVCGPANLVVLDLDSAHGQMPPPGWAGRGVRDGRDVLALLAADHASPDPVDTYTVVTPTGGEHRYFTAPPGDVLRNSAGSRHGLGWRVDVRAGNGVVAAAGSVRRIQGRRVAYRAIRAAPVAPLPDWLIGLLTTPSAPAPQPFAPEPLNQVADWRVMAWLRTIANIVAHAEPGTRHATLNAIAYSAGRLIGSGDLDERIARATLQAAAPVIETGRERFTQAEADRTIEDALQAGRRHPRSLADRIA